MESVSFSSLIQDLRNQHAVDLERYRAAHQNASNRTLHHVMIPVQMLSFFLLLAIVWRRVTKGNNKKKGKQEKQGYYSILALGWTLGVLATVLSPDAVGAAVTIFYVLISYGCTWWVATQVSIYRPLAIAGVLLAVALTVQVLVGHWWWEGKQPNVVNSDDATGISWLAMTQTVLIAWKS